ncbi:hypothetical protein D915_006350 [Fasciola hepatica]|uniref:Uncharacterized protein n=1 Tax=Fasciola hepatica TaxID=6192 RepID=A0A4E0RPG6_FASHE|nr:hypothetical protein D915_006350 [Fasciola hepatica]
MRAKFRLISLVHLRDRLKGVSKQNIYKNTLNRHSYSPLSFSSWVKMMLRVGFAWIFLIFLGFELVVQSHPVEEGLSERQFLLNCVDQCFPSRSRYQLMQCVVDCSEQRSKRAKFFMLGRK